MTENVADIFNALRSYALSLDREIDPNPKTVELMTATKLGEMWLKARNHSPTANAHAFLALINTADHHNERLFYECVWDREKIEREAERYLALAYGIASETGLDTKAHDSRAITILQEIQDLNPYVIRI